MQITLKQFQASFFDSAKVLRAVDRANRKNLSKAGAFVRTRARSSLRRRKKVSVAGQPPSVHSRDTFATLKNILFGYDERTRGVVVGPVAVNGNKDRVPELMEKGGHALRKGTYAIERTKRGRQKKKLTFQRIRNARSVHYEQRPFMGPALARELPHILPLWRDSVKG